jgi:hypothetical protein
VKGGSLVAPQSQADILKRAVIIVVAGQANVGFLCKPRFCGEYQSCRWLRNLNPIASINRQTPDRQEWFAT